MVPPNGRPAAVAEGTVVYVQWAPIFAGAVAAAALSFVLHAFAAGIGLSISSTAPTWRDASIALVILSGLYLILVALAAYGAGGYLAGRMRTGLGAAASPEEVEFRDGTHGVLTWAVATLLTAVLAWGAAQSLTRLAAPSAGSAGPSASVAGENIIAFDLDRLFRGTRAPEGPSNYARAEAARILLTSSSHRGMQAEDRAQLVRLVATHTGLAQPDAERRVEDVIARARENISRARRSTVIVTFMAGAAALLGAAAAWFAACAGGKHRDGTAPAFMWASSGPARRRS
jgi:hypothetical protein